MIASEVLLDTWAWWEILFDTPLGRRLRRRYLGRANVRVHTSVLTIAEIGAKLAARGEARRLGPILGALRSMGPIHEVTATVAEAAGPLRQDLRRLRPDASLVDALVLATARAVGARLVSGDGAFKGVPDVVQI